jgi:hypothetical protein
MAPKAKSPHLRTRPQTIFTLSPTAIAELLELSESSGKSRSAIVDDLIRREARRLRAKA